MLCISTDWFLYVRDLCYERVNVRRIQNPVKYLREFFSVTAKSLYLFSRKISSWMFDWVQSTPLNIVFSLLTLGIFGYWKLLMINCKANMKFLHLSLCYDFMLLPSPNGNYIFKVNRNTRTRCEICSNLTINNDTNGVAPVSLLLTLNIFHTLF